MVWDERTDAALTEHYRRLAAVRKCPVFDRGEFAVARAEEGYIEIVREKKTDDGTVRVRVGANLGSRPAVMHVDGDRTELYTGCGGRGDVTVAPCGFVFIKEEIGNTEDENKCSENS